MQPFPPGLLASSGWSPVRACFQGTAFGGGLISTQGPPVFQQLERKPVFHRGDPTVLGAFSLTPLACFVTK